MYTQEKIKLKIIIIFAKTSLKKFCKYRKINKFMKPKIIIIIIKILNLCLSLVKIDVKNFMYKALKEIS